MMRKQIIPKYQSLEILNQQVAMENIHFFPTIWLIVYIP
jgi:hypothetical protein